MLTGVELVLPTVVYRDPLNLAHLFTKLKTSDSACNAFSSTSKNLPFGQSVATNKVNLKDFSIHNECIFLLFSSTSSDWIA